MIKWTLQKKSIHDLQVHPKNPRSLSVDEYKHLRLSIDKFGLIDKPIINLDGMVIGGHQRLNVLQGTNTKTVECWIPDRQLTSKEVDELNIRLNKNTGEWDWDILANEWDGDDLVAWGFKLEEFALSEDEEKGENEQTDEKEGERCPQCLQRVKKR